LIILYYLAALYRTKRKPGVETPLTGYVALCNRCRNNLARRRTLVWFYDYCHIIDETPGRECDNCKGDIVRARLAARKAS